MPRKPDDANLDNRIRKLREQLGITQDRLGEVLGMNGDAIRNLENGRMKITAAILRRIIIAGAEYSTKRKIWLLTGSRERCTWVTFMAWRQAARRRNNQKRKDYEAFSCRVAALLAYAKPDEYNMVFARISELLDDCLERHPSPEAEKAFKKAAPKMWIRRKWTKDSPVNDEEEQSVAEEFGLPSAVLPNSEILEVTRTYEDFPSAAELLPEETDSEH